MKKSDRILVYGSTTKGGVVKRSVYFSKAGTQNVVSQTVTLVLQPTRSVCKHLHVEVLKTTSYIDGERHEIPQTAIPGKQCGLVSTCQQN